MGEPWESLTEADMRRKHLVIAAFAVAAMLVIPMVDAAGLHLTCPADATVQCLTDNGTNNTGVATASDSCSGGAAISYSDVFGTNNNIRILGIQVIGQDVRLTWQTEGNSTNVIQAAVPTVGDSFTNGFHDIATVFVHGTGLVITNFIEVGGATNTPSRFYRIELKEGVTIFRIWTATDACGNSSSCTQQVIVVDNQAPTIVCPANIVVTNTGIASWTVTAQDNCPGVTWSCTPPRDSAFTNGTTTVHCTAVDASDNTATCSFAVTVVLTVPLAITCPSNITTYADAGQCSASNVTYAATGVSDCSSVGITCVPPSGSTFPLGTNTVSCTATDNCNDSATCSFTVAVVNQEMCDLVGWWKVDEGSGGTAADSSGNGNGGVLINNPLWTNGLFSGALQFNGSINDSYLDVPISSSLDSASTALTVSAWVNTTSSTPQAVLSYRAAEYDSGWRLFYDSNALLFQWTAGNCGMQGIDVSSIPLPTNQWVHIAAVFNPPNVYLYLDGSLMTLRGSSGSNLILTANNTLKIGRCDNGDAYWFNGGIDDVRVYSRALSAQEIAALCNVDTVGDGIPNWWRFKYFRSANTTNSSSCASCEPLGDGLTNLQAYQHGTDPLHPRLWQYEAAWNPNSTTITISPTGVGNMFYTTDTVSIATSDSSNIRVFTFRTNQVYQGPPTTLSGLPPGHYFVESAGTGNAMGDRMQFLVLPANYKGAAEWGADGESRTVNGQPFDYYQHLQRLGVGYVRDFSYWYNITRPDFTAGQYDWTEVNDVLACAASLGAKAVFQMGFWPQYMTNASQCTISAYLQYVTDFCNNIKTNQHASSFYAFTLWNEPGPNNGDFHYSIPDTNSVSSCFGSSGGYPWPAINGWDGGWTNWLAIMYQQAIPVIRSILPNAVVLGESLPDFAVGDQLLSYFQRTGVINLLDGESHHYYDQFGMPDQPNPICYNVSLPTMLDRELSHFPVPSNTVWLMDENALYGSAAAGGAPSSVLGIRQSFGGDSPFVPYLGHMDWWNGFCDAVKTAVIFKSRNVHPILHMGMRGYHSAGPEIPFIGWAASPDQNGINRLRGPYPFRSSWIAAWSWLNGATYLNSQLIQTNNTSLSKYEFQNTGTNFFFVWTLRGTSANYSLPGYTRIDVFGNAVNGSLITEEPTLFIQ
jgi:hypothetical protein